MNRRVTLAGLASLSAAPLLRVGPLAIDVDGRVARLADATLELTGLEFDLLVALARRAGRAVARDALLELAGRGDVAVGERTVDVHVSHLRAKLGDDPRRPRWIKTVRGVGYVLAAAPDGSAAEPDDGP